jgi:hypothetical protein
VRGAATGSEIPFDVRVVDLGVGKCGRAQNTLVVEWRSEGGALKKAAGKKQPKSATVFLDALFNVLVEHGADFCPYAASEIDGPTLRFHASCPYRGARQPCMVALLRDIITDAPRAIQRTALIRRRRKDWSHDARSEGWRRNQAQRGCRSR